MLTSIIFAAVFYTISWVIQKAAGRSSSKADKVNNNVFVFSFIGLSLWDISSSLFTYIDYDEKICRKYAKFE